MSCALPPRSPSYSQVLGRTLVDIGAARSDIVTITAAMPDGTGLSAFRDAFPGRFFDVGIAEAHAVTFAAGLALCGLKPVVALYSTFLQRAFDQIVHDVALDNLNVTFCVDRAGLVGEDGPTHHGVLDLSFVRSVPGALIMAPCSGSEFRRMLYTAMAYDKGPVFIRYCRGCVPEEALGPDISPLAIPEPELVRNGSTCALVCIGDVVTTGLAACAILDKQGIRPTVVNARFVKPLSLEFYQRLFSSYSHIVTLESNSLAGGFGSAVLELAPALSGTPPPKFLRLGYPDCFLGHGSNARILEKIKLDSSSIASQIAAFVDGRTSTGVSG